jgi:putative peptide zinc metalloprotease protein
MTSLAASLVASSSRPLRLRARPDLAAQRQRYQGSEYWVVKDPLALKYYRFHEEEYALLQMLDGAASLDQIRRRFEQRFVPQKISLGELSQFIGVLHQNGLVIADTPGQGSKLLARHGERIRKERLAALANVLAFRLKGFDPDRLLNWLHARIGWLLSFPAVVAGLAVAVAAVALVLVQFEAFTARLPSFYQFFGPDNWFMLAAVLATTKVLHEFGHGLACKRFRGECHEMGVMFLVFTPCLYCNVSDSWMLPNKWHRAAIGAAGMYVEIVVAGLCTFVWWLTEPGLLHYLCLNVMFVSSVSTILFNANPLMRYDGYYILSDLAEIPNLRQKSSAVIHRKLALWLLGLEETPDPFLPKKNHFGFALYALAAEVYRWLLTISILWLLYRAFEPYGLAVLGHMLAAAALAGMAGPPLWRMGKFFTIPGRIDKVKKPRLVMTLAAAGAAVAAVLWVPLPYRVYTVLEVQPKDAAAVYVDVEGRLEAIHARPGDRVRQGQPLVTLSSIETELAIARLEGEYEAVASRLEGLRRQALTDEAASLEMAHVEESLATLREQVVRRREDLARLVVVAPADGTILPAAAVARSSDDLGSLPNWSGTPLDERNLGARLAAGTLVCRVGDPRRLEVVMAVDQSDIELLAAGQSIDIQLAQLPGQVIASRIEQISQFDLKVSPKTLSAKSGGRLATRTDAAGRERPLSTTYQASAPLADREGIILLATSGEAKIHAGGRTIAWRGWRFLSQTFRLSP